ncbi:transcriptional regulator [Glaciihabitans arcticus]|uniref:Transcriptional regulator n=1 Tax=Glaciihabitans arcticus TaxID=2668039 RepID=A0A4Q9H0G4_9MICO|nr:helix-turn-helix domain-containing protein [Glaciihabitans arcticus]TBN58180.1 transcriptional regulator [Glaciihabitans arcticus]
MIEPDIEQLCRRDSETAGHVRDILDRVGDKWSMLVISLLEHGPRRYGSLASDIPGISQRMLTVTLQRLERDGLVTRTSFPEIPPRVEYALSSLGETLKEPIGALARWAYQYKDEFAASRDRYDEARA